MRRGLPGHDFAETWLVSLQDLAVAHAPPCWLAAGGTRRGRISVAAAMLGLGSASQNSLRAPKGAGVNPEAGRHGNSE